MKRSIIIAVLLAALALMLAACSYNNFPVNLNTQTIHGSGTVTSEVRSVSGISKVELMGIGNLTIQQGNTESLTIQADENLLPYITTEVIAGTLKIGIKPNINFDPTQTIEYRLTVKSISGVALSGFGNIQVDQLDGPDIEVRIAGSGDILVDAITADNVDMHLTGFGNITANSVKAANSVLNLTGSGDLKINSLEASTLNLNIGGFGTATVSGSCTDQVVNLTGSGKYQGGDLQTSTATVKISGLGNATLWATDSLDLAITGSGNVNYYDVPRLTQTLTGLGSVKSLGSH